MPTDLIAELREQHTKILGVCGVCQDYDWPCAAIRAADELEQTEENSRIQRKIRSYVAFVLTGDEQADVQLAADHAAEEIEGLRADRDRLRAVAGAPGDKDTSEPTKPNCHQCGKLLVWGYSRGDALSDGVLGYYPCCNDD